MEDRHIIALEKYAIMESTYENKMFDKKKIIDEIQSIQDTLDGLKQAKSELDLKEKEFSEISDMATQLQRSIEVQKIVESDMLRVSAEVETLENEQNEKESSLRAAREKFDYLQKIKEVTRKDKEQLNDLQNCWEGLSNNTNELSLQIDTINTGIHECNTRLENLDTERSKVEEMIAYKDTEISGLKMKLEQIPEVQEKIETQVQKLEEYVNEIMKLEEHENNVITEIQEQGKVESDRMEQEISESYRNIEELRTRHEDLNIKRIHDEESFSLKIADVKNQRNEYISHAVEKGIQEIDIKHKKMDESVRKARRQVAENVASKKSILKGKENTRSPVNMKISDLKVSENKPEAVVSNVKTTDVTQPESTDLKSTDMTPTKANILQKKDNTLSETDESDSDPFAMSNSSQSDEEKPVQTTLHTPAKHTFVGEQNRLGNNAQVLTPNTSARKKRFLVTQRGASNAASHNSSSKGIPPHGKKDVVPGAATAHYVAPTYSSMLKSNNPITPGRAKKILIQPAKNVKPAVSSDNLTSTSNVMTPGRTKKILIPEAKKGNASGASSADEEARPTTTQTPGGRREKKRMLITRK